MLKGIIFDLDGTITLTEPLHHKAFSAVFKEYGIDFTYEDEITKYAGSGSRAIFTQVFAEKGVKFDEDLIAKCMAKKKELYTKIVQKAEIIVVPGVHEFVKRVEQKGIKKIIATGNSNLDAVKFILGKVGLKESFPDILLVSEVARGKPFPDIFLEAAKRMGLKSEECVVLEDSINGVAAASSGQIRCIALETTTKRADLLAAGASAVVKNYNEITDSLLGI